MMIAQYSFNRTSDLVNGGLSPEAISANFAYMGNSWWCCVVPTFVSP
jgi:hypothetical protein